MAKKQNTPKGDYSNSVNDIGVSSPVPEPIVAPTNVFGNEVQGLGVQKPAYEFNPGGGNVDYSQVTQPIPGGSAEVQQFAQERLNGTGGDPVETALNVNSYGQQPQRPQNDIQDSISKAYSAVPQVTTPDLTNQDLMPTLNQNINKGSYSGSIVGNVPIFTAGPLVAPWAALNKRKQQLEFAAQQEALRKAKALEDESAKQALAAANFKYDKTPEAKDKRFQESVNKQWNNIYDDYVDLAKQEFGSDWARMLNQDTELGRGLRDHLRNTEVLVTRGNQVVEKLAKFDLNNKDLVFDKATREVIQDFNDIKKGLVSGDYSSLPDIEEAVAKAMSIESIEKAVAATALDPKQTAFAGSISDGPNGEKIVSSGTKKTYDEGIKTMTEEISKRYIPFIENGTPGFKDIKTVKESIEAQLRAKYQNKITASATVKDPKDSGNKDISKKLIKTAQPQMNAYNPSVGGKPLNGLGVNVNMKVGDKSDLVIYDPNNPNKLEASTVFNVVVEDAVVSRDKNNNKRKLVTVTYDKPTEVAESDAVDKKIVSGSPVLTIRDGFVQKGKKFYKTETVTDYATYESLKMKGSNLDKLYEERLMLEFEEAEKGPVENIQSQYSQGAATTPAATTQSNSSGGFTGGNVK